MSSEGDEGCHYSKIFYSSFENTSKTFMITMPEVDILKVFISNSFGPI
jgi:hypothetical protein